MGLPALLFSSQFCQELLTLCEFSMRTRMRSFDENTNSLAIASVWVVDSWCVSIDCDLV